MLVQSYATRSLQMLQFSLIYTTFRGVICSSTCFDSGCQCSSWPSPWVGECREMSSGTSGSILCSLALANLPFCPPDREFLIGDADIGALGFHLFWHTWQNHQLQHRTGILHIHMNLWSHHVRTIQGAPRIASSSSMCNFWHHFPLNLLHFNLYLLLIHSLPHSQTWYLHCSKWNQHTAR